MVVDEMIEVPCRVRGGTVRGRSALECVLCPFVDSREDNEEGFSAHLGRDRVEVKLIPIHTDNFLLLFHYFLSMLAPLFILVFLRTWVR
jgi:hypothetical protein